MPSRISYYLTESIVFDVEFHFYNPDEYFDAEELAPRDIVIDKIFYNGSDVKELLEYFDCSQVVIIEETIINSLTQNDELFYELED